MLAARAASGASSSPGAPRGKGGALGLAARPPRSLSRPPGRPPGLPSGARCFSFGGAPSPAGGGRARAGLGGPGPKGRLGKLSAVCVRRTRLGSRSWRCREAESGRRRQRERERERGSRRWMKTKEEEQGSRSEGHVYPERACTGGDGWRNCTRDPWGGTLPPSQGCSNQPNEIGSQPKLSQSDGWPGSSH